jgi:hypothetical protein
VQVRREGAIYSRGCRLEERVQVRKEGAGYERVQPDGGKSLSRDNGKHGVAHNFVIRFSIPGKTLCISLKILGRELKILCPLPYVKFLGRGEACPHPSTHAYEKFLITFKIVIYQGHIFYLVVGLERLLTVLVKKII